MTVRSHFLHLEPRVGTYLTEMSETSGCKIKRSSIDRAGSIGLEDAWWNGRGIPPYQQIVFPDN